MRGSLAQSGSSQLAAPWPGFDRMSEQVSLAILSDIMLGSSSGFGLDVMWMLDHVLGLYLMAMPLWSSCTPRSHKEQSIDAKSDTHSKISIRACPKYPHHIQCASRRLHSSRRSRQIVHILCSTPNYRPCCPHRVSTHKLNAWRRRRQSNSLT